MKEKERICPECDAKLKPEQHLCTCDEDYIECYICGTELEHWLNHSCPGCHEPVCKNCSEGLSDMYYGYCNHCMGGKATRITIDVDCIYRIGPKDLSNYPQSDFITLEETTEGE